MIVIQIATRTTLPENATTQGTDTAATAIGTEIGGTGLGPETGEIEIGKGHGQETRTVKGNGCVTGHGRAIEIGTERISQRQDRGQGLGLGIGVIEIDVNAIEIQGVIEIVRGTEIGTVPGIGVEAVIEIGEDDANSY